jgi:hypothetical protein
MYRTLYMKCTVLLVFLQSIHCSNMHFWYNSHVQKYTHLPYFIHQIHCFASVLIGYHYILLQKQVLLIYFTCTPEYTCTVLNTCNALFCKCFHVFSRSFYCWSMYFWYISNVHRNTHVPNFIQEMHCFANVFMCFHEVFTAETCTFCTFHM